MTENPGGGLATCAFCGARFPAIAARFCPACGRDVGTAPAIPPAPSATPAAPPATTSAVPAPPTQAPAFQYPQAYGQPQAGGFGPGFPAGYGFAPLPARRNRLPILVGLGVAGLVLVIVAGALVVAGAGSGKASLAPSPLAAASATAAASARRMPSRIPCSSNAKASLALTSAACPRDRFTSRRLLRNRITMMAYPMANGMKCSASSRVSGNCMKVSFPGPYPRIWYRVRRRVNRAYTFLFG